MTRIAFFSVVIFFFFVSGCNKDDEKSLFDIQNLRKQLVEQVEKPSNQHFKSRVTDLQKAIHSLQNNLSKESLSHAKMAWFDAAKAFSRIEIWNIGEINSKFLHAGIYSWGAQEEPIEAYISSSEVISMDVLSAKSTNMRGLTAIEYILYHYNADRTIVQLKNNRRMNYLVTVINLLNKKMNDLIIDLQKFRPFFIKNNKTGIEGGINMLINQMNALLETINITKIGIPTGLVKNKKSKEKLQAYKSEKSLELIVENINSVKDVYFGKNIGIDDYVNTFDRGKDINDKIKKQFEIIERVISKMPSSLANQIDNQPSLIEPLYQEINQLIKFMKVDVASTLSITITPTDNDGD